MSEKPRTIKCRVCGKEYPIPMFLAAFEDDIEITDFVCERCERESGDGLDWEKAADA